MRRVFETKIAELPKLNESFRWARPFCCYKQRYNLVVSQFSVNNSWLLSDCRGPEHYTFFFKPLGAIEFMKSFQAELTKIKSEIQTYSSTDCTSELESFTESFHIKERLSSLLWEANNILATQEFLQLKSDVLSLFSETIGCTEDENLFLSMVRKLIERGVLSDEDINVVMEGNSTRRWR